MRKQGYDKIIGTYLSADHKTNITCFQYVPHGVDSENPPIAVVQIIHGMCDYTERYEPFIRFLTENNVVVCSADHIGHGRTAASEFDLGYFAEKDGDLLLVKDAFFFTKKLRMQYPQVSFFFFGHSMGSFILRDLLVKYPITAAGAIISGTGGPDMPFSAAKMIVKAIRAAKGSRYRSKTLWRLMFGAYNHKIDHPKTPYDWISSDPEVVKQFASDPKCAFCFTAAAMEDLVNLYARISRPEWAQSIGKDMPLLLIAGEEDPVGNYGKGVQAVFERLKAAKIRDLCCKLYPKARHELHNELHKEQMMQDVLVWMKSRIE